MGLLSKSVLASLISMVAINASAAVTQLDCANAKNTVKWSFQIRQNESRRISSDITYVKGAQTTTISSISVAQYAVTNVLIYMLTDDSVEKATYRLTVAPLSKNIYAGTLEEFGASSSTTIVKCTASSVN